MLAWFFAPLLAAAGPLDDGIAALKAGDAATARTLLEAAAAEAPTDPRAHWELGWAAQAQGDLDATVRAWETVEKLDPTYDELQHWLLGARTRQRLAKVSGTPAPIEVAPSAGQRVRLAAAGDTMLGSELKKGAAGLAPGNGETLLSGFGDVFRAADVAFLNLEGPLADGLPARKCRPASTACHAIRTPTRYVAALTAIGLDVASLANNHAMDLGVPGMDATMATLDAAGIAHAGRTGDVARIERDGLVIAVLAAHSGSCCLNVNRPDEIAAAVRDADTWADLVVVSFHGGAEGPKHRRVPGQVEIAWGERRGDVKAFARAAVDAGADLVLGHGPHVLRAVEVYRGRLIAYSLGNFIGFRQFGTMGGPGGTTAVLDVTLAANGALVAARLHAGLLDNQGVPHPDPTGAAFQQIEELSRLDFPETGVRVGKDGTLTWAPAAP